MSLRVPEHYGRQQAERARRSDRHFRKCFGNQLCRNMGKWLVQNPDCVIEAGSLAVSYGISGSPDPQSLTGQLEMGADLGFLLKECMDRTPGRGRTDLLDGGACSFSGDTAVLMADGSTKAIADVELEDWVLAEDPETGTRGPRQVTAQWVHEDQLVDLEVDGGMVRTTEDHPFWNASDQQWQRADTLDAGDGLQPDRGRAAHHRRWDRGLRGARP
jgi:hypothetical protein